MFVKDSNYRVSEAPGAKGFSALELVIAMAVVFVITGIAIPTITNNLRIYQLNSVAAMVADQLKSSRSDAIRRNLPMTCYITPSGNGYQLWTDNQGTGTYSAQDHTTVISGARTLLPGSAIPTSGNLAAALQVTGTTTLSGNSSQVSISFDQRGAVTGTTNSTVNVLYIGYPGNPAYGYRAVVLMPSGSIQVWTAAGSDTWQQFN